MKEFYDKEMIESYIIEDKYHRIEEITKIDKILSSPINNNTMRKKISINLSQATHRIKLEYFPVLMDLLK